MGERRCYNDAEFYVIYIKGYEMTSTYTLIFFCFFSSSQVLLNQMRGKPSICFHDALLLSSERFGTTIALGIIFISSA